MAFQDVQNPGIGGLDELTVAEEVFLQNIVGLSYSTGDILYYDGTKLNRLPRGSDTQVLTLTSGIPAWGAGGGGTGITWSVITVNTTALINNGYVTNKGTTLVLTLPTTAPVGSVVEVSGMNAGGWQVAQNASGVIHFGNQDTTTGVGGSLASTMTRDAIRLVCVVANNEWNVLSSVGNITIV